MLPSCLTTPPLKGAMKINTILIYVALAGLSACDSTGSNTLLQSEDSTAGNKTISLIELNDLHAHLTEHMDYKYGNKDATLVRRGGLARIATAINRIRQENPNHIVMNIGDTYHGGVEALYTTGNAIVDPVNALNIDIGVPGNWDFAYGPSVTRLRYTGKGFNPGNGEIRQVNYQNLAANVSSTTPIDFLPATSIISVDGIDIGFIGITSDIVPSMFAGFAIGFEFLQGKQNYVDLIEQHAATLRAQGADAVVVMSELGIHKDIALADAITANLVDVFFSAHTHEVTREPIIGSSGAWVVEAGNDTYLGRLDLTFDSDLRIATKSWKIIEIDNSLAEDAIMKALVDKARQPFLASDINMKFPSDLVSQSLTQPIDTVIGYTNETLDRRHALTNRFNRTFTQMLQQYAGTDIAITPGFRYDSVIPAAGFLLEDASLASGEITIEDAYRFFPVTFNLASGKVTGKRLKEIIEQNLNRVFSTDTFAHSGGWFDGYSGLTLTLNLKQDNTRRINSIKLAGSDMEIRDTDIIRIAGCVRPIEPGNGDVLCSYSGIDNITPLVNPDTAQAWTAIDFLIQQLLQQKLPAPVPVDITDLDNTLLWPDTEFVQPLRGAQ